MSEHTPWCCDGYAAFCPLCPRQVDLVRCPGHAYSDRNRETVRISRLHANREHPDFEYHTTKGARKQFDASTPPADDEGSPDSTWEVNLDAGRDGWERFDYHEEAYWRRPKRKAGGPCARPDCGGEQHTDPWGTPVQCPHAEPVADTGRRCPRCDCPDGHEQCQHCKICPHARQLGDAEAEPDTESNNEGHPEPPTEEELVSALPVRPDPRQPAYDAVYEYIRGLGGYLPSDPVYRNAVIWRAVHAALDATPVGRCVSSHCVEDDHMVFVERGWETP